MEEGKVRPKLKQQSPALRVPVTRAGGTQQQSFIIWTQRTSSRVERESAAEVWWTERERKREKKGGSLGDIHTYAGIRRAGFVCLCVCVCNSTGFQIVFMRFLYGSKCGIKGPYLQCTV